jgi:uncharacterized membrane protein
MDRVNTSPTGQTVVGVFDDVASAERAINDLKIAGFAPDSISVVTRDRREQATLTEATGNRADEGAIAGALGGGTLGAVLGWLLAGGTALIPGIGPVVAAGVFGATVTGALVGGALGSVASALVGQGIPDEEAHEYEEHVRGGRTLLTVTAANGQLLQNALDIFDRNNATGVRYYNQGQTGPGRVYSRGDIGDTTTRTEFDSTDTNVADSNWRSTDTTTTPDASDYRVNYRSDNTPNHPASLDRDNATNVDQRDFGVMHTDSSSPDYRDETYRTRDRYTDTPNPEYQGETYRTEERLTQNPVVRDETSKAGNTPANSPITTSPNYDAGGPGYGGNYYPDGSDITDGPNRKA